MKLFKNYYKEYQELKKEVKYFSYECYLKEERYRKLNKEFKELERKYKELLKEKENGKKNTGTKRDTRKSSGVKRNSRQTKEI